MIKKADMVNYIGFIKDKIQVTICYLDFVIIAQTMHLKNHDIRNV